MHAYCTYRHVMYPCVSIKTCMLLAHTSKFKRSSYVYKTYTTIRIIGAYLCTKGFLGICYTSPIPVLVIKTRRVAFTMQIFRYMNEWAEKDNCELVHGMRTHNNMPDDEGKRISTAKDCRSYSFLILVHTMVCWNGPRMLRFRSDAMRSSLLALCQPSFIPWHSSLALK